MSKVIFSIKYDINPEKRGDYLDSIKEFKTLVKAEGLLSYDIFESKGTQNRFEEIFTFESDEAYDNFDDSETERMGVLLSKIENLKVPKSTKVSTLVQIN